MNPPEPQWWQRALARPHFVQRIAVINATVFHRLPDRERVLDIHPGIAFQHQQVGELARLEAAELSGASDDVRAANGRDLQQLDGREPAARERLQFLARVELTQAQAGLAVVASRIDELLAC